MSSAFDFVQRVPELQTVMTVLAFSSTESLMFLRGSILFDSASSDVVVASPFTATCVEYRCDNLSFCIAAVWVL